MGKDSGAGAASSETLIGTSRTNDEFMLAIKEHIAGMDRTTDINLTLTSLRDNATEFMLNCSDPESGLSLIKYVINHKNIELCKIFAKFGVDFSQPYCTKGLSDAPIHDVVATGDLYFTDVFLETFPEVDINTPGESGYTPTHIAAKNLDLTMLFILASNHASATSTDELCMQPIHFLAQNGDVKAVQEFLKAFSNTAPATTYAHPILDACDATGQTPLHIAAYRGHLDLCIFLREQGAYMSGDANGCFPFQYAARNGHQDTFGFLLQQSLDLPIDHLFDLEGTSVLHLAAACNDRDASYNMCWQIMKLYPDLLQYCNINGYFPLHFAAFAGDDKLCNAMLLFGASVPWVEQFGISTLYTLPPSTMLYELLTAHGANPWMTQPAMIADEHIEYHASGYYIHLPHFPDNMHGLNIENGFKYNTFISYGDGQYDLYLPMAVMIFGNVLSDTSEIESITADTGGSEYTSVIMDADSGATLLGQV